MDKFTPAQLKLISRGLVMLIRRLEQNRCKPLPGLPPPLYTSQADLELARSTLAEINSLDTHVGELRDEGVER